MNARTILRQAIAASGLAIAAQASAQVTFYEHSEFRGRAERLEGFKSAASSVVVRGAPWELCNRRDFGGRCVVLQPGRYPSLGSMGMNDNVSSLRPTAR